MLNPTGVSVEFQCSLSTTRELAECKWFSSTSKWLHELLWYKQSRWGRGDTLLNEYESGCSAVWLCTQLFSENRLDYVIFLLAVSHKTGHKRFPSAAQRRLIEINLVIWWSNSAVLLSRAARQRHQYGLAAPFSACPWKYDHIGQQTNMLPYACVLLLVCECCVVLLTGCLYGLQAGL